ncbi:HAMP domain-containing protein [Lentzea sp. CA-135723]|uniref:HAMP domain-containing protein n=1 Tax=Lentzea sp. CA-135723 TaxID=3239950 RepID=UPI003D8A5251
MSDTVDRMTLERQCAEAGFPSGVRAPLAVLAAILLLLLGFCAVRFSGQPDGSPVEVVARSHEWFATNLAHSAGASVTEAAADLTTAAKLYGGAKGDEQTIAYFAKHCPHARGIALVDAAGALRASTGEPVPFENAGGGAVRVAADRYGGVRAVTSAAVPGSDRVVVVSSALEVAPAGVAGVPGTVLLVDGDGEVVGAVGGAVAGAEGEPDEEPVAEPHRTPATGPDGKPVVGSDGKPAVGPDGKPMVGPDGKPAVGLDGKPAIAPHSEPVAATPSSEPVAATPSSGPTAATSDGAATKADPLIRRAAAVAVRGEAGHLVGSPSRGTVPIVAYAPLASGPTDLGLSLLLVGSTPRASIGDDSTGPAPVLALLGVLVLAVAVLVAGLTGPVRRLRRDALAVTSGQPGAAPRRQWISETHRIAAAFAPVPRRRLPSALVAVGLVTVTVLGWAAAVLGTAGRHEVPVPEQAVQVAQRIAETTAASVRRSLQQSLTDLRSFAELVSGTADPRPALQGLTERRTRYRSVYVVDAEGRFQARAGRVPLRAEEPPPPGFGLHQQSVAHRVPVIYAAAPLPGGRFVVGELDVVRLSALVRLPGGTGRLVDAELRTVAATVGYQAYEPLAAEPLRASVNEALRGLTGPAVRVVGGHASVVASAVLPGSKDFTELRWAVVVEQPVTQLPLPGNHIRRTAWLAALVATVVALGACGWCAFVLVLPLRRLAAAADRFASGDTATVVYPQRADEIGTVARCLELHRQSVERRGS